MDFVLFSRRAATTTHLGRIDLRVALENVDDSFDDLLPGEMVVAVGRHGPNGGVEAGEGPRAVKGLDRETEVTQDGESQRGSHRSLRLLSCSPRRFLPGRIG